MPHLAGNKALLGMMVVHDLLRLYFLGAALRGVPSNFHNEIFGKSFWGDQISLMLFTTFVEGNLFDNGTRILHVICHPSHPFFCLAMSLS